MTIFFQECNKDIPSIDPTHSAMMTIDNTSANPQTKCMHTVDKYLPELQSMKAVLNLEDNIRNAWLHAIRMEIKNLIDHETFTLGKTLHTNELIIPVKVGLKAKQTSIGKLDKLKACLVAQGNLKKCLLKRVKAINQHQLLQQHQEIAESSQTDTPRPQPVEPVIYEDTLPPCASSKGVELLLPTFFASCCSLKSAVFIGAYLQAKVIGCHSVKLPLDYAYHFSEFTKFFGDPLRQILEYRILRMALLPRVYPISSRTILFCPIRQIQSMASPPTTFR